MQKDDQLVVVRVGDGFYGISVESVREIVKTQAVTPIPHTPSFVEGLMNLRGQIVTVINLEGKLLSAKVKVNATSNKNKAAERIVVTYQQGELIGLRVDAVEKAITLKNTELELPDDSGAKEQGIIEGVLQVADTLVMKLNTEQLLKPLGSEGGE